MEKEKKYFKGMFIGLLLVVVMLFGVVINMGKTYSADTTPNCVSEGGVEYVWTTNLPLSSDGACCPKGGTEYVSVRDSCAARATKKSDCTDESESCYSCPNGYALACNNPGTGSSNGTACFCSKKPGKTVENVCYSCSGRYAWGDNVTSYNCPSTWEIVEGITKESDCKRTVNSYEVKFNTDGGTFYVDNKLASSTTQSLSTIEWSKYTAKKEGYAFKGWTNTKTSDCSSAYTSGSSNVLGDKEVYACYYKEVIIQIKYTVTLNAGSGGTVKISKNNTVTDTAQQNYEIKNLSNGYSLALSSYIAETNGKSFKGWSKSSSCNSIIRVYTIDNNNATLYACYSDTNNNGNDDTTKYSATFDPDGGTFSDGTTTSKTVQYTGKKYFTDSDITVTKSGATFAGWRSSKSDLTSFIDGAENGETLTAIWYDASDSGDSGNEGNNCEYITKESCENYYDGYICVEDNNGCFVPNDEIEDNQKQCEFESKESCEILNEGYSCKKDSNGCFVKYGKIDNDSGSSNSKEPVSNPNTGTSLLYLAIIMAVGTLVYTIYYVFKLRKEN